MGLFRKQDSIGLQIEGMTCGGCVRHVTTALQGVPGVVGVEVDLAGGTARVTTKGEADLPAMVSAVDSAGYKARPST